MSVIQQLLTEHLDIWTAAETEKKSGRGRSSGNAASVYGIKKLRELILELAVRGKLVPQDANDEPASELLKRIQAEKTKLIADGKIKKNKPLAEITDDEKPFDLPQSWEWSRLGLIGYTQTGSTPSKSNSESFGSDIPFIKPGDIYPNHVEYSNEGLSFYGAEQSGRIAQSGSLLMVCIGTIGKCNLIEMNCSFNQQINSVTPYIFDSQYLLSVCRSVYFHAEAWSRSSSTTIAILNKGNWEGICIPVPPIEEQHRIVTKVDELMALCDQLETQHSNAAEAHEKLVRHLLGTLTQSPITASPLCKRGAGGDLDWQRIAAHFDILFTTEASIDALKQTLLQLAVMGKLVSQDANEEPASELFSRIAAEKKQLLNEKKYQKTGKLKPKELIGKYPENWVVVQIGEICPSVVPSRDKPKSFSGDIPWITLPSFPFDGWYLDASTVNLRLTIEEATEYSARVIPENSVLMSCIGRFGLTAINQIPVIPNQQIHAFIPLKGVVPEFLSIVIRVSGKQMEEMATSTTIAYLNKSNCESIEFGLPPSTEQMRIVTKVDELMAICDQLKSRITEANQLQQKLADVMVEQAIS
ncbi:MAG: restriction endonuclease subunit S [Methylobacter sp.]|nr:restriction endonuclease subunit S [Methylobacter sp.]